MSMLEKVSTPHLRQLGELNAASARNYLWLGNYLSKTAIYHEQIRTITNIKEQADTVGKLYAYAAVYGYITRYHRKSGFNLQKDIMTMLECRAAQIAQAPAQIAQAPAQIAQAPARGGLGRLIGL